MAMNYQDGDLEKAEIAIVIYYNLTMHFNFFCLRKKFVYVYSGGNS